MEFRFQILILLVYLFCWQSSEECCINMFEKWLYLEGEDATWDQLLTAVSNIGLPSFANDLQQKLLGNSKFYSCVYVHVHSLKNY